MKISISLAKFGVFLLPIIGVLPLTAIAQGPIGGYFSQKGHLDISATYSRERYDTFWDADGALTNRALQSKSYNIFAEYALADHSALVFSLPYIDNGEPNNGLQDASLWLKYRNQRERSSQGYNNILTSAGLSLPVGNYPNDNIFAIGNRAAVFHARVMWQHEADLGWFLSAQAGADLQFSPVSSVAVPLLLRGGWGFKHFYFDLWLERYISLGSANANLAAGVGSTWTRGGGTFYVPVAPWMGVFTGAAYFLGGKNIGQSLRANAGVVFRLP